MRLRKALALGSVVFANVLCHAAAPALAEDACADVWLERESAPRWYLLGPSNCRSTPFDRALHLWNVYTEDDHPPGSVNGFGYDLWITAPV